METWSQQFEIIKEKISKRLANEGKKLGYQNVADFLGVKKGRVENWFKGQRPSLEDLQKIGSKLNLSSDWLLYGTGNPEKEDLSIQNIRPNAVPEPAPQICPSCSSEFAGHVVSVHATSGAGTPKQNPDPEPIFQICIPERFFWKNLMVIEVDGSSMEPLIRKGAFVGLDTGFSKIVSGEIYGVHVPYEGINC